MSENAEIYTAGKNFTLPPALTAWKNSTSDSFCFLLFLPKNEMQMGVGLPPSAIKFPNIVFGLLNPFNIKPLGAGSN